MRLMLIGPPGSGKGTQAKLLSQRLGLTHVSTGEMLREAIRMGADSGKKAKPYVDAGKLVPDTLVNEIIADYFRLESRRANFVLDGYPRTLPQAVSFDQLLRQLFIGLDAAVYLKVEDEEVVRRLAGRGRGDDAQATIRKRLEVFHATHNDLIEYYRGQGLLREIKGEGNVETIYAAILKAIKVP